MKVVRIYHAGRDSSHRERDRALAAAGVDLTLIVPSTWPGPDEIVDEPFRIIPLNVHRSGDVNRHTYADDSALREAIGRPDVLDVHEEPFSSVMHQILGVIPADQVVVGYTAQNIDKRFPPPFMAWERQALRRLRGLYPCSRQAASVAVGKGYAGPVSVLRLAPPASMTAAAERALSGPLTLLLAGRMVPEKGVRDAVHLLARLGAREAQLTVIGEGPEIAAARELAATLGVEDRLLVSGWLSPEELARAYQAAQITLVPSRSTSSWTEQFGRVVVEAQACGSVVVAYDSGALAEIVGEAGALVPEGDVDELHRTVANIAASPWLWTHLRQAGLNATADLTWDRVAADQISLYRTALAGAAPSPTGRTSARHRWGAPALSGKRPLALPARMRRTLATPPSRPLRVVYLDHVARLSGGELALLRLIPALPGVQAHVILAEDGPLRTALEEAGVRVEVLPMRESTRDMRRDQVAMGRSAASAAWSTAGYSLALARRLRELKPDLVHANSLKSGFYGGVAARLAGVPLVWHLRDRVAEDYLPTSAVRITRTALRTLPTAVIANSDATLSTTGLRGPHPGRRSTSVIPSVAQIGPDQATIGDSIHLAAQGRSPAAARVGIIGRISPWKGQDVFLRAMARLPGIEGRIIGSAMFDEDAYEAGLRTLCRELGLDDRVTFAGFTDDVPGELARLGVLVHASTTPEPFGQVIVEGMAAGVPVIATAAGGAAEIIEDGVNGLLLPPGDDEALAAAIERLLSDPDLRDRLIVGGRSRARDFHPSIIGPSVRAVYDRILRSGSFTGT